ncbi:ATP-binding protein [Myceligenerans pegani]|uniref:tRNA(Ile)-lysidine synthase n=1 Tax=Myceligenerans pegani TaxID=2776917 RepID=A0ABR9MWB2_9MICO|nr:tRNA lysidine(34) synthetase [Myceligenerans sp. TRM 65318]MBE1875153.1 tRNA lysidine(34) synthetase TilS [Myceligenerans sp. TRM 65318]MBE3017424.1 tRNA lysidine(34) synthetase TilS [Myceligenerans sp. TRM 65318]
MARVESAVRRARGAVRDVLAGLPAGSLVLVACSGGADSLALAAALAYEAPRVGRSVRARAHGVRAGAVVVDHGLQEGSDDVAARAAEQCRDLGLDPVVVRRTTPGGRVGQGVPGTGPEPAVPVAMRGPAPDGDQDVDTESGTDVGTAAGARVNTGPEAAAREARYAVLEQVAAETGADLVLLGHTLDDQAEQVLLGLARGAGARSLAGMPAERGRYRRPFLGLRRTETEAVCAASGLDYWVDPTNLVPSPDQADRPGGGPAAQAGPAGAAGPATTAGDAGAAPLRSQVRGIVMPVLEDVLGPGVAEALARSAAQLRDDADALETLAAELLARARVAFADEGENEPHGREVSAWSVDHLPDHTETRRPQAGTAAEGRDSVVLDVTVLAGAPAAVRRRALRLAAHEVAAAPTTARHIDALDALVVGWSGQGPAHLPGGARAERSCGRLFLRRERA